VGAGSEGIHDIARTVAFTRRHYTRYAIGIRGCIDPTDSTTNPNRRGTVDYYIGCLLDLYPD
jgi:hypothetical protein